MHDPLTGLPNRDLFQDRLAQGIASAKRERKSSAMIMMDLDKFKEINDTLGHDIGDQLLKETGRRLKHTLRQSDTVSRLGGDEFAIVLPSADAFGATCAANKLLKALETPFIVNGKTLSRTCSIGIAVYPDNGRDADSLYKCADTAMYIAKRKQSGYYVCHSHDSHDAEERMVSERMS
jgi:two-component system CheB/CheR fusion protein